MDLAKYKRLPGTTDVVIGCDKLNTIEDVMEMNHEDGFKVTPYEDATKHLFPAGCGKLDFLVTSHYDAETLEAIYEEADADPDVIAYGLKKMDDNAGRVREVYGVG